MKFKFKLVSLILFITDICLVIALIGCSDDSIAFDNSYLKIKLVEKGYVRGSLYYSGLNALNTTEKDSVNFISINSNVNPSFGSKSFLGLVYNTNLKGEKGIYINYRIDYENKETESESNNRISFLGKLAPKNKSSISIIKDNYERINEYIHPSMAFFESNNRFAKYWMFVSNYPDETSEYEDDDLLYSNDLINWDRVGPSSFNGKYKSVDNIFLPFKDNGRENAFLPIPYQNSNIIINGKPFVVVKSLKHDPEILYYNNSLYLYNFYNFYETKDGKSPHRFIVLFRTSDFIHYDIVRTDGSMIPASKSNLAEIFTQSSVDGKNNYIRYFDESNADFHTLKDAAMQIVCINNVWYAYYSEYGLFDKSNLSLKRYKGTSPFSFDWNNPEYCQTNRNSSKSLHTDVKFYKGKVYVIGNMYMYESADGLHFTESKYPVFPSVMGNGYKPEILITDNNKAVFAHGSLISTYTKARVKRVDDMLNHPGGCMSSVLLYAYNSFDDIIQQSKNGYDDAYIHCIVSIITPDIRRNTVLESYFIKNSDGTKIDNDFYKKCVGTYNFAGDESIYVYVGVTIHKKNFNINVELKSVDVY